MAKFGLKYPCFKPHGESTGVVLGKAVAANLTITNAEGEIFADDALAESESRFASGSLATELDDMTDAVASKVYGHTVADGELTANVDDEAPEGVLGYYMAVKRGGVVYYIARAYQRAQAQLGNENSQTRGGSITFQTTNTTFKIKPDDNGDWKMQKTFTTEAAARAWVNTKCAITDTSSNRLSSLKIGNLTLSPAFDPDVTSYTAATSNATNTITAVAESSNATIEIKNGATTVNNGSAATWSSGSNTLTVTVDNDGNDKVYTVTVTKS